MVTFHPYVYYGKANGFRLDLIIPIDFSSKEISPEKIMAIFYRIWNLM